MRRRSDDWINATHILKAADYDKPARTRILEREVQKGVHEKVQGGYGKYQGTCHELRLLQYNDVVSDRFLHSCRHLDPAARWKGLGSQEWRTGEAPAHLRIRAWRQDPSSGTKACYCCVEAAPASSTRCIKATAW